MGHDDRTRFFFWEWFMVLDRFNSLRRIGLATDQVSVLSGLCHCQTELLLVTGSSPCLFGVPRVPCATCSSQRNMAALDEPKSTTFDSVSNGSFHRERERSPRTPLPPPAPLQAPGSVYPVPCTPMTDARQYRNLFSHRRVAPPTPPYHSPPPSDEEPSESTVDPVAELEGDPDEPY
ncbi:hypothetical protein PIB30_000312 [Stylosanthes scabra]|uniref:Uncharacterized protein n=1 Tax=Stylosanthes scabra TaxID=79078 RepID=A0ABU6T2I1_9FABA|nr:hypothetical protein [Stylosanthes scabra]